MYIDWYTNLTAHTSLKINVYCKAFRFLQNTTHTIQLNLLMFHMSSTLERLLTALHVLVLNYQLSFYSLNVGLVLSLSSLSSSCLSQNRCRSLSSCCCWWRAIQGLTQATHTHTHIHTQFDR